MLIIIFVELIDYARQTFYASQRRKPSLQHFDSLSFLKDQFTPRSSGGNLPDIELENNILTDDNTDLEVNVNEDGDDSVGATGTSSLEQPVVSTLPIPTTVATSTCAIKRKQNENDIGTALE
ncbi:hypothetical protein FQR65_LT04085 [Abscondita terminalis]|nr:hypothetical protein FQR65_LT04085 [Abscondita terminalis]